jgi:anti-anti-sigma factor
MRQPLIASWTPGEDGTPTVTVSGEIDMSTAPVLDKVLCESRMQDPFAIIVSLENCTYCDSSGLGVLIRHARQVPHLIVISAESSHVRRLLRVSRADEIFEVVSNSQAANALRYSA